VLADVVPYGKHHTLPFVVASTIGVWLSEVSGDNRAIDRADDVGQTDFLGRAGQDVTAANAAL
jgi:hypothetical protein